jgi:nitroimidazol reductase NimA-like FMN-containing flavoprotein (pyridoxamine 5'-phosphate oxidase superfamily)
VVRRKDKAVKEAEISEIIKKCQVCRLALSLDDKPYIVPVSFGFDGTFIYFHSARAGKKIDILSVNNNVCFEFESDVTLLSDATSPCNWSFSFQSVIGFGKVEELSTIEDKIIGLNHIMRHYSDKKWDFKNIPLSGLSVWKISIDSITGKQSPPPSDNSKSID